MFDHNPTFGISPLTWHSDNMPEFGAHISVERCLSEMREAGFLYTEIGGRFPQDSARLKTLLAKFDMSITAAWFSSFLLTRAEREKTYLAFAKQCNLLAAVGAKYINVCECTDAIHLAPVTLLENKPVLTEQQWRSLASGLNLLGQMAAQKNLKLAYHFHLGTLIQNETEVHKLMEITDPKWVHLLLDTGHAYAAGVNIFRLVKRYGKRIAYVHLKDVRVKQLDKQRSFLSLVRDGLFTVPGDGDLQFWRILRALKHGGFGGDFMVEAEQDPEKAPPKLMAQRAKETVF